MTVDLARSGAVPGLAGGGGGPAGSLHVLWWQPAGFGSSPDPAYYDGANPMALRSITFVASSVCGAKAAMSAQVGRQEAQALGLRIRVPRLLP